MARATSSAEVHQSGQSLLVSDLLRAVARLAWPQLDPHDLAGTLPKLLAVVMALVRQYGPASSAHAAAFYRQERRSANVVDRFSFPLAAPPATEEVRKQLEWATSGLYGEVTPESEQAALTKVLGVVEKLVLDQSRDTIIDAVAKDPKARGWARVPEPGACAFCLMLATRGAVYKSEKSAGRTSNARFVGDGEFKVHDHCRCHIEPVFNAYEPTATVRAAQAVYASANRSGGDKLNNFRAALKRERDAGRFAG